MSSRYFIHNLRRLIFRSTSFVPGNFRRNTRFWVLLGSAVVTSHLVQNYVLTNSKFQPWIVQAKTIAKELTLDGTTIT